jgi:Tol biopolymer transport system component
LEAEVPAGRTLSGRIVFQSNLDGDNEIYLLAGGRLTRLTDNGWEDRYPRWSPEGRAIAFSANPHGNFDIFVMNDRGEDVTPVTNSPLDEVDLAWSPDGKSLAFSEEKKKILGKDRAIWIVELASKNKKRLVPSFEDSHQLPDLSPGLPLLAFTGKRTPGWDVFLYDLKSREIRSLTKGGKSCRPRFSPDGRMIAYVSHEADGKGDIWILATDGANPRRLTARDEAYDYFPSWSPDGEWVVFCSNFKDMYADKGDWGLYLANVGDGSVTLLFDSPGRDVFPDWR